MPLLPRPGVISAPYQVPRSLAPVDLKLDSNEGATPSLALLDALSSAELLRRYPSTERLTERIAEHLTISSDQVLVTAGGDDALDRVCRALLAPGDTVVVPVPGFEMLVRYAELAGATVKTVPWSASSYPTQEVIAALEPTTRMVVVTSPNNPTGGVASAGDLRKLAEAAPDALILVDLAYAEFADEDLTDVALSLPNTLVIRTFSKAWGLAGLRVGYALAAPHILGWLRVVGAPYAVSALSIAVAERALEQDELDGFVQRVRAERDELYTLLQQLGAQPQPSQGNFVFARAHDPVAWRDALAGLGIGIRAWPGKPGLSDALRITCPGDEDSFARLVAALRTWREPEALLFDLDGVLVDVSTSYRTAILRTCEHYGVQVSCADIQAIKAQGDANNDWVVTQRLLARQGIERPLAEITALFESFYQGSSSREGLWLTERLLVSRELLQTFKRRLPLGIVTGRPRRDAERFLTHFGLSALFDTVICMEDGPAKPDPAPVQAALAALQVRRAWMVGDTVDDVRAARDAGVLPFGILAPGDRDDLLLLRAGATRVLPDLNTWLELLP